MIRTLVACVALSFASLAFAADKAWDKPPEMKIDVNKTYTATIDTTKGKIVLELFPKEAPKTVNNFVFLAREKFYDGTIFHRVIPGFMIQTGDPTGTGAHNCGYVLNDEIVPDLKFDKGGRLAMANTGTPNSGACQFFITEDPFPKGNGQYTIFGQVVEGQELVAKIAHVIRDDNDKPRIPTKLINVTFVRIVPKEPAQ